MNKIKAIVTVGLFLGITLSISCSNRGDPQDVRSMARRASVQTVFHRGVIHISFTKDLEASEELTAEKVKEMLEEEQETITKQIEKAIEKYKVESSEDRYETSLTDLEKWGYESKSKTFIPLGAFAPKWAKFPENIIIACKTEKEEISPWEKEYEDDVLAISETANVSPTKAREILLNIKNKGYSITKEEVKEAEEVELLYFSDWDTSYPRTLDWKVTLMGEDNNLIISYDPRGILEVKPIPDDKKVYVKAGYFDFKDKFKEEATEIINLREKLETIEENLKKANEVIYQLREDAIEKPEITKRDITQATMWDLRAGKVKLEEFYFISAASGVFLGNMPIRDKISTWGPLRGWGFYQSYTSQQNVAVILSNAHVVAQAMTFAMMVDEDKENLWVIFPGAPFIRHTKHSDYYGTPAWVMGMDETPVMSWDCDAGILLSTAIPAYEQHKVVLGNSDNVKPGDEVVTVGNPIGMQKFTSQGVIANTEYSMLDTFNAGHYLKHITSTPSYSWMLNSNFWIDTTIGAGGVSGSGVWATEGSEAGKVIAIRNMGMITRFNRVTDVMEVEVEGLDYDSLPDSVMGITQDHFKYLFKSTRPTGAYTQDFDSFLADNSGLKESYEEQYGGSVAVAGMNGCIPINYVKRFLQERGLDPAHFQWAGLKDSYWEK